MGAIAFYAHKRMRQLFFLIRITGGTKIMAFISLFEVIGPNMVGPSSSHTAGAASMALLARKLFPGGIKEVHFTLYGSFAKTYRGHAGPGGKSRDRLYIYNF